MPVKLTRDDHTVSPASNRRFPFLCASKVSEMHEHLMQSEREDLSSPLVLLVLDCCK